MKKFMLSTALIFAVLLMAGCHNAKAKSNEMSKDAKVQVALLLDTSGSMDGLIEQAKSRLWNIVNTLTTLKFKGETPRIEIALYEYGNDRILPDSLYIRRITPLTTDLDLISEKLFALTTFGGSEYCGGVIDKAVKNLEWGRGDADMKLIYIAGNEPFTQGPIDYTNAISGAVGSHIYVNTIHCGSGWGGVDKWRDGAIRGKGKFFTINHDVQVRYYDTPYDDRIHECNMKLNATYISYSKEGESKKVNQTRQDENAKSLSSANYAERAVSKTSKAYVNNSWDLVDKVMEDAHALEQIEDAELSDELQNKSKEEIKALVIEKKAEREKLQKEMSDLARKRQIYIDGQMKKDAGNTGDDLGKAIERSVLDIALAKGYEVVN